MIIGMSVDDIFNGKKKAVLLKMVPFVAERLPDYKVKVNILGSEKSEVLSDEEFMKKYGSLIEAGFMKFNLKIILNNTEKRLEWLEKYYKPGSTCTKDTHDFKNIPNVKMKMVTIKETMRKLDNYIAKGEADDINNKSSSKGIK